MVGAFYDVGTSDTIEIESMDPRDFSRLLAFDSILKKTLITLVCATTMVIIVIEMVRVVVHGHQYTTLSWNLPHQSLLEPYDVILSEVFFSNSYGWHIFVNSDHC